MNKSANFMILPEFRLILECCKGNTSVEDAIKMKKDELSDMLYDPNYNIIVDIREFETSINATISKSISSFYNFLKELDLTCKVAFLTTKPHQVVLSEMLKRLSERSLNMKIAIFTSLEAAIEFVGFSFKSFELIRDKILALNENTVL
jgi:hypothetical protein